MFGFNGTTVESFLFDMVKTHNIFRYIKKGDMWRRKLCVTLYVESKSLVVIRYRKSQSSNWLFLININSIYALTNILFMLLQICGKIIHIISENKGICNNVKKIDNTF